MARHRKFAFSHQILIAHGTTCPYCSKVMRVPGRGWIHGARSNGHDFPTRDHVIPRSRMPAMGTIIVCRKCNNDKNDQTLDEWLVKLLATSDTRVEHVRDFMQRNKHLRLSLRPEPKLEVAANE